MQKSHPTKLQHIPQKPPKRTHNSLHNIQIIVTPLLVASPKGIRHRRVSQTIPPRNPDPLGRDEPRFLPRVRCPRRVLVRFERALLVRRSAQFHVVCGSR